LDNCRTSGFGTTRLLHVISILRGGLHAILRDEGSDAELLSTVWRFRDPDACNDIVMQINKVKIKFYRARSLNFNKNFKFLKENIK